MKKDDHFDAQIFETVDIKDPSLIRFIGSIPSILLYQFVTKFTLYFIITVLNYFIHALIRNIGIGAITNLDIPFLFKSWQGIVVLIIVLIILVIYTIFDINCTILIADNILHQKGKKIFEIMKESIFSAKYLLHPKSILLILFVSIIAPLTISFFGISLTESFYIPSFIMQVVNANLIYRIPYYVIITTLAIFGFLYLYSFHIMLFRKVNISVAMHTSRIITTKYKFNFIKRILLFWIKTILVLAMIAIVFVLFPFALVYAFSHGQINRFWLSFLCYHCIFLSFLTRSLIGPFQFMELSRILESYTIEDEGDLIAPHHSLHIPFWSLMAVSYAVIAFMSFVTSFDDVFDMIFPLNTVSDVVAHRAGGTLANENTIWGLNAAIDQGVYAAEIDIQRTKDDHYIVYHDDNFARLCNLDKMPEQLTLKECKELKIIDTFNSTNKSTDIATIEEMLDASKGKIHLYVELKGATADKRMADDLYAMIVDRDMLKDVTVISLKYDLIDYLETQYPEVRTGYLCFVSLGDISSLKCDELLLEDELASSSVIDQAHAADKKVYIWTINSKDSMQKRMLDDSDGIITDEVKMAGNLYKQLSKRDDFNRVLDILIIQLT